MGAGLTFFSLCVACVERLLRAHHGAELGEHLLYHGVIDADLRLFRPLFIVVGAALRLNAVARLPLKVEGELHRRGRLRPEHGQNDADDGGHENQDEEDAEDEQNGVVRALARTADRLYLVDGHLAVRKGFLAVHRVDDPLVGDGEPRRLFVAACPALFALGVVPALYDLFALLQEKLHNIAAGSLCGRRPARR